MFGCLSRRPSRRPEICLGLLLPILLSACQAFVPTEPPPVTGPAGGTTVGELLRYADMLPGLSEAALGEELAAVAAVPPEDLSAADAIRIALLHVEGRLRLADPEQARRALETAVLRTDEDPELVAFASLLLEFLRAGSTAEHADSTILVAYPTRPGEAETAARRENERLSAALAAERSQRLQLEQQLEALRDLEQALDRRTAVALDETE